MAGRARTALLRTGAVCAAVCGLGFGLPAAYAPWYFAQRGRVWVFAGFPTYGEGPFAAIGIPTSVPLLVRWGWCGRSPRRWRARRRAVTPTG